MDQHYDDFFENARKATDKGSFLKLPRFQKNLKYNFDGFSKYSTKIAHIDLPGKAIVKLGRWANQHPPLQLRPPTPGKSRWCSGVNFKLIYKLTWCDS